MTKILCAIDDTEHSKPAIDLAAKLAQALDAELTILVVNQLIGGYGRAGGSTLVWTSAEVEKALSGAAAEAKKGGASKLKVVNAESRDVARAITTYAEDNHYDQIVVGTGGKGAMSRMMLGSVSGDVVQRAHCPVTVAR
ncbi:universal stress protein [Hyphomicrobium sp.]|uniref:universal stress protein n=1 Tax=Hyphomicrobium sp. TaxID=82 RepID=UPI002E3687DF|nr:universal stress protein [Hyphomicrobium sp.]HEX2841673.1 universal stress protein [Hyphomicrobium sp.]